MAVRLAIVNENGPVLDFDDTRIGDGDSEDVGGEVLQARFRWNLRLGS